MIQFFKKVKKKRIINFIVLLLIAFFICSNFVYFHKVSDTYNVLEMGYEQYSNVFLKDGRIISCLSLKIGNLLQIPMEIFITTMGIIAIIIQTLSVYLIYNVLKKNYITIEGKKKYLLLAGCFLVIFNPFSIEHLAYAESAIITLGTLFSVMAAIQLTKGQNKNILFTLLFVVLSVLCYQGTLNVFITISTLFLILETKITKKEIIKRIYLILISTLIALVCCYMAINIGNTILNSQQDEDRLLLNANFIKERIIIAIKVLPKIAVITIIKSFGLIPKGTLAISILVSIIYIIVHENFSIHIQKEIYKNGKTKKNYNFEKGWLLIGKYIILILIAIISAVLPIFLMNTPTMEPRISSSIGAILGLNIIYILFLGFKAKRIEIIIPIIVAICLLINVYQYKSIGHMNQITNAIDEYTSLQIGDRIIEYEKNNKVRVENIAFVYDKNTTKTYLGINLNTYTERALSIPYCVQDCIEYYIEREFKTKKIEKEIYEEYFKNKDWHTFQSEQVVFKGDTVYVCIY